MIMMRKAWTVVLLVLVGCMPSINARKACLNPFSQQLRIAIKKFMYGGLTKLRNADIEAENTPPLANYEWKNTIFIHWHILPGAVSSMEDQLSLKEGLSLVPITLSDEITAKYTLTLCVRQIEDTVQFDLLTYVMSSQDTKPHLLVVESRSSDDMITPFGSVKAAPIKWEAKNQRLYFEDAEFKNRFFFEIAGAQKHTTLHREFSRAFDKMYYPNALYTQIFSNGSLAQAKPIIFDSKLLLNNVHMSLPCWETFLEQNPFSAAYFPETIVLGAALWTNYKEVDSCLISERRKLHNKAEYLQIYNGSAEANFQMSVTADKPSYFLAFKIREEKKKDFLEHLGLPTDTQLSRMRLRENGPSELMLALNVYSTTLVGISGLRAEWNTFFLPDSDSVAPRNLVAEATSNIASFDPVHLFTSPAQSFHHKDNDGTTSSSYTVSGGWLNDDKYFSVSYPTPDICNSTTMTEPHCDNISTELTFAQDEIYWGNLVADRGLFNDVLGVPVRVVDPSLITVDITKTGFAAFVEPEVLDFFVFNPTELQYFLNPMYNLEEIGCGWCDSFPFLCAVTHEAKTLFWQPTGSTS